MINLRCDTLLTNPHPYVRLFTLYEILFFVSKLLVLSDHVQQAVLASVLVWML